MPLSRETIQAFQRVIKSRPKTKPIEVDGHSDFVFVNHKGKPKVAIDYSSLFVRMVKKYNKHHKENPLPHITPHILRHTFCTKMAHRNMNPKDLQYIMAVSYTHLVKEQTYIEAMRCLGAKKSRIMWKHMAPNILSPIIVQVTFVFASSIITEAALSFLGAGVPAPAPSWGNILNEGKSVIYNAWWMVVFPGIFTAVTVLGLNLLGDGIRDFIDPMSN